MRSLRGKVVVVTGASRGIGEGIVRLFAENGTRICLIARNKKRLTAVAKELGIPSKEYLVVAADITRRHMVKKIVNAAVRKFGQIDIFVNNAGVGIHKPITETAEKEFDTIFNTNLKAVYYSFLELIPLFRRQGEGQIINISSLAGRMGVANLAAYSSSKAALNVFSEAVALEVRNENIKISVLAPASTDTGLMSNLSRRSKSPSRAAKKLTVAEVAEAVIFLAKQNTNAWTSMTDIRPLLVRK
ncbi:MAG: SDR family NAD(P)-dependent oxidoreductase [Candidatus Zixiibacteriota bacterium]|nr:MAG: SDR family NAD(P)-dependent oxidoreductase [candidate division Zixibacteria bacterium]